MSRSLAWAPSQADGIYSLLRNVKQLGNQQSRPAVAELLTLMDDDSPLVRSEAACELARVGRTLRETGRLMHTVGQPRSGILTAQGLINELQEQRMLRSERWREAWAESLGLWQHEGAVPALGALMDDPSPAVRASAAQALGKTRDIDALTYLRRAATDANPHVRRNVAYAVGTIGLSEGIDILGSLRTDSDILVRCATLQALGSLSGSKTLVWLHAALHDPDPQLRWQAARSLARVGSIASLSELEQLYDDDTPLGEGTGGTVGQAARLAAQHIREREGSLWSQLLRAYLSLERRIRQAARRRLHGRRMR